MNQSTVRDALTESVLLGDPVYFAQLSLTVTAYMLQNEALACSWVMVDSI